MIFFKRALLICICAILISGKSNEKIWGFYAHKKINRLAVFTLPPDLFPFYKRHIDYVSDHAVDPDKRRYAVEGEAPRHYIDIDHYAKDGENPFDLVPKKWSEAIEKYTEDTLQEYGVVPWYIPFLTNQLTNAFMEKDVKRILRTSADLGHYIADAHVPLHTTENYNGQFTDQKGIHGFWESRIPELFDNEYDFFVGRAQFYESPLNAAWNAVEESNRAVDSVLTFEKMLSQKFESDKMFAFEQRGGATIQNYSYEYSKAYSDALDGMVERRMKKAVLSVGSFWYTAWLNAGKPDLDPDWPLSYSDDELKAIEELDNQWNEGKIKGREHQD